jgi:hypothetical protein
VSGGKFRVSRPVGLHTIYALLARSPRIGLPLFLAGLVKNSSHVAMAESPVSYLESTVPAAACEIAVSFKTASCACFYLSSAISSSTVYIRHYLRPTATVMARKRLLQTSWMLSLQRMATRVGGETGKRAVDTTAITRGLDQEISRCNVNSLISTLLTHSR